ncbi:hypothetical protein [Micromonospora sp. WMMD737]|uniref:hypothetical protein n=1 Tax=Micromonospora sp. WMMD737 TaxID=3404113 RepID=UPI003B957D52
MELIAAIEQGDAARDNEDWVHVSQDLVLVLDGATARTDTGCVHGVAWFVGQLGQAIVERTRQSSLPAAVAASIPYVAGLHPECDLSHPGTPSAAVGALRIRGGVAEYLVLGDVSVVLDTGDQARVITDDRVSLTASAERAEADRYPIGAAEKQAALLRMKQQELAARNSPGGYWVAETNPAAVDHALTGQTRLDYLRRFAVLSDGAARAVAAFNLYDWRGALDLMQAAGATELIRQVRAAEQSDPQGTRWPRNKCSDDATAVFGLING